MGKVVADQRRGLLVVDKQPIAHRLRLIVGPPIQLTAALVALALDLRRVELHMIHRLAVATHPAAGQPVDHCLVADFRAAAPAPDAQPLRRQRLVQRIGLGQRAREAIQDRPGRAIGRRQAASITMLMVTSSGTSSPGSMYFLASSPSGVCVLQVLPEDIAGRDLRQPQRLGQHAGLRALAGARRTEHDDEQRFAGASSSR